MNRRVRNRTHGGVEAGARKGLGYPMPGRQYRLTVSQALNPLSQLGRSGVGVDLGGAEPLVTQRDLHDRERRAAGQPRRERMAEGVRGTADVKVSPLPVALDEVPQRAGGEPAVAASDQERGLTRHSKPPGAVEVHQVDDGLAGSGVERDLAMAAALADHLNPLAGEAVPGHDEADI